MTTLVAAPDGRIRRRGNAVFGVLQRIGRSLMMPIAVLPIAGLFQRFGQPDIANRLGVSANNAVSQVLLQAGNAIFDHLPLLFAVGVAIALPALAIVGFSLAAVVLVASFVVAPLRLEVPRRTPRPVQETVPEGPGTASPHTPMLESIVTLSFDPTSPFSLAW